MQPHEQAGSQIRFFLITVIRCTGTMLPMGYIKREEDILLSSPPLPTCKYTAIGRSHPLARPIASL